MSHSLMTFTELCEMLGLDTRKQRKVFQRWLLANGYPTKGLMNAAIQDAAIEQFDQPRYAAYAQPSPRHGCIMLLERFCELGKLSQPEVKTFLNSRGFRTAYGLTEDAIAVAVEHFCDPEMTERINREVEQIRARSLAFQKWWNAKPEPAPARFEYFITTERLCRICNFSQVDVENYLKSQGFAITQVLNNASYQATVFHFSRAALEEFRQAPITSMV